MNIIERKSLYYDNHRFGGNRELTLKRDNYQCVLCNSKENIIVHHKNGIENNEINNLITLCRCCHFAIHYNPKKNIIDKYIRDGEIYEMRLEKNTFRIIAEKYNITRQRAQQIFVQIKNILSQ